MTTPTQALNTSKHNSTTNEEVLLNDSDQHPYGDDTISVRTDSTTVPAANLLQRVTISPTKSEMSEEHERIRLLAEEVITSLPKRKVHLGATFFPRVHFASSIILATLPEGRSTIDGHFNFFLQLYRQLAGEPTAELEDKIRELARLFNSFQTAILAQIVQSILHRERNNFDPPAAVQGASHPERLSDLTAEHSDPRPLDPAPFQIPAAARIPLVNNHQNPPELHSNDSDSTPRPL